MRRSSPNDASANDVSAKTRTRTANLVTYDEYVELFSEWQERLLYTADKIQVTGNITIRTYWRNVLSREFSTFLKEVNEIEKKIQQMTPSIQIERMNDQINMGNFQEADEDDRTIDAEDEIDDDDIIDDDATYDYDDMGSVDMMFDDIQRLREEYRIILDMTESEIRAEDLPLRQDILDHLECNFIAVSETIKQRMLWTSREALQTIGWIDELKPSVYLQNTGPNGQPVILTDARAVMVSRANETYDYAPLVPVRLFHDDGSFTDFDNNGVQI